MRAVVAVLLFVAAAHGAFWGLFQEKQQAPDFRGILPSVSYAPFEGTAIPTWITFRRPKKSAAT